MKKALVLLPALFVLFSTSVGQQKFGTEKFGGQFKGFTRSPNEHMMNSVDKPFTVSSVQGTVILYMGERLAGVLVEIRGPGDQQKIRSAETALHPGV